MSAVMNPYASPAPASKSGALAEVESNRAIAEIQSAMAIAKRFPRDPAAAVDNILQSCGRLSLAEAGMYSYPRGNELVTGPSIRLAECIAQNWGNMQFGIRELEQRDGESLVESFAWDIQTNTRQVKTFSVPHIRHTRKGAVKLTDPRDIYELVANTGARRLRACILGVVPGDVVDVAVRQCEATVAASAADAPAEQVQKLVAAFAEFGVTADQIAKRLGHNLEATVVAEIVQLRKIYASIRDGFAKPDVYFDPVGGPGPVDAATAAGPSGGSKTDRMASRFRKGKDAPAAPPAEASNDAPVAASGAAGEGVEPEYPQDFPSAPEDDELPY